MTDAVEAPKVEFAFAVIKNLDGRYAISNIDNSDIARQPSLEEVYIALNALLRDLDRQAIAVAVTTAMQQMNKNTVGGSELVEPTRKFVKRS